MHKISEGYLEEHESELVRCPKCNSEDVIAKIDEKGYFWIHQCNNCGYVKKNNKPGN